VGTPTLAEVLEPIVAQATARPEPVVVG
jgi:hypothetical protein